MEGAFCDGRANAVCDPTEGRRDDGFAVPGVRYFTQDRAAFPNRTTRSTTAPSWSPTADVLSVQQ
jgi:hypothetical protein